MGESHPLSDTWFFYTTQYDPDANKFLVTKFEHPLSTVEDFFTLYDQIKTHSPFNEIRNGGVSIFKDPIQPKDEDKNNLYRYYLLDLDLKVEENQLKLFLLPLTGKFNKINGIYTTTKQLSFMYNMLAQLWTSQRLTGEEQAEIKAILNITKLDEKINMNK